MVTADFAAYAAAQRKVDALWSDRALWADKTIRNTANMGWFSADRTIREYARDIWNVPHELKSKQRERRRRPRARRARRISPRSFPARHSDPFAVLGLHQVRAASGWRGPSSPMPSGSAPRCWTARRPAISARRDHRRLLRRRGEAQRAPAGPLPGRAMPTGEWSVVDPYAFGPVLGPMDDYYGAEGHASPALRQARRPSA